MSSLLKRLRLKFMLTTTGIVAVLVVIIAGTYCFGIYNSAMDQINRSLDQSISLSSGDLQSPGPNGPQSSNQQNPGYSNNPDGNTSPFEDQRIDLFHGKNPLVYSVVTDSQGNILRVNSPAIEIDSDVLSSAISSILSSPDFSMTNGSTTSGKLPSENLFYKAKVQNGSVYIALADASPVDEQIQSALLGSLALTGLALLLTIAVSFFLARLFLRPVEDAWNKQRRFIADASHELKTPLTVIMANTEIVRSNPTSTVANEMKWLDGTMDESERMHGLIADLLLLARMDDEQVSKNQAPEEKVDFSEAVENTLMSFEAIAFERGLNIEETIEPGLMVCGVKSRLIRLPDILVDNACKYTAEKGKVKVTLKKAGDKAVLRVFNNGPEIAEADLEHLFDRFYRADESRCDDIPGYGLGLSIAQSIAEEIKGTIEVENVANEGVAFIVTLPLCA